jgi:hypothetical protein
MLIRQCAAKINPLHEDSPQDDYQILGLPITQDSAWFCEKKKKRKEIKKKTENHDKTAFQSPRSC